jgi:biotin carboxylase
MTSRSRSISGLRVWIHQRTKVVGRAYYRRAEQLQLGQFELMSFRRLLSANRGEIAIRVIEAASELELGTVTIFSEDDARSLHVARAEITMSRRIPAIDSEIGRPDVASFPADDRNRHRRNNSNRVFEFIGAGSIKYLFVIQCRK